MALGIRSNEPGSSDPGGFKRHLRVLYFVREAVNEPGSSDPGGFKQKVTETHHVIGQMSLGLRTQVDSNYQRRWTLLSFARA